jgi:hypothetical protein
VAARGARAAIGDARDRVREVTMRRREFIGLLAAIAISPHAVLAQTTKKRPLVGWLYYSRNDLADRYLGLVLDGMRDLGDIEGRDFEMVYTSADGHVERLLKAAEELGSELINFFALTIRSRFVLEEDWDRAQEPVLAER